MYQSEWTDKPVLHLFPHWNWIPGDEIDMWCYYNNADEVELFVNGKSEGIRKKSAHQYHVMWRVTFEPGEVQVVARKNGQVVGMKTIRTAGQPDHIRLSMDYKGKNTNFIVAEVVDRDGNLCPWAEDQMFFVSEGDGKILGTDNGCQTSMESFKAPRRKAFFGRCLVVVSGHGQLTAKSYNLKPASISF
jgi:beta-galactosidase